MLNQRVSFQGKRGTIRYVGPVSTASNRTWFGVEWDLDGQGLHNGSLFDLETNTTTIYFTCAPTRGSFIKPEKAQLAQTLVEAFALRYEEQMHSVRVCSLANSALGQYEPNAPSFPLVDTLDLSSTLFSSWDDLLALVQRSFPQARELLALDNGKLVVVGNQEEVTLPKLETLVLTRADASAVHCLFATPSLTPNLRLLCLSNCGLSHLPPGLPAQLQELDLSFNRFTSIPHHSSLPPSLLSLNMSDNIGLELDGPMTHPLALIQRFYLDHVRRRDWTDLETLDASFPNLLELILPLEEEDNDARKRVIVRLPKLVKLNKSPISPEERVASEIWSIKTKEQFARRAQVLALHPEHAAASHLAAVQDTTVSLIRVRFHSEPSCTDAAGLVDRMLPRQTKLVDLFTIFNRLFARSTSTSNGAGLPRQISVNNGRALSKAHCARDALALGDVIKEGEMECTIICT